MYEGEGLLVSGEQELAHYGYRWTSGHESRFTLGICALDPAGDPLVGLVVVSAFSDGEALIYRVCEPEEAPWGDSEALGQVQTRHAVLEENVVPEVFTLVDAIASREPRIYTRVLSGNES
jgi:hypothetical protein